MTPSNDKPDAQDYRMGEVRRPDKAPTQHLDMEDLRPVRLALSVDLGTCPMLVREVLELKRGSVVRLNKVAGETTDVTIGGQLLARGEVVVIGDSLHVRISDIVGTEERLDEDGSSS
jgi:flagellar motor switch protein FliN/FliY